mgnify:CR=1 FL=1
MLAEALAHLVRGIVDTPDAVRVDSRPQRRGEMLEVRVAPEDLTTRFVAESAGMEHAPDLYHVTGEDEWLVLELPWVRVTDRIPARAREAISA